ncbi:GAF domain-containing protein [Halovenus salina]|uniref:GAF domain-containing protein n=1 Tax=Halovenus salina TaxID=1510225 RepID=A0ABD5W4Y5_9EURY
MLVSERGDEPSIREDGHRLTRRDSSPDDRRLRRRRPSANRRIRPRGVGVSGHRCPSLRPRKRGVGVCCLRSARHRRRLPASARHRRLATGEAFRTGKTVVEAVNHEEDEYDRSSFTETMYVPIGETGVLGLGTIGNRFDETDLQFAEILADNAVAAISLVSANESLRRERERLDQFASVVSHDLKNP